MLQTFKPDLIPGIKTNIMSKPYSLTELELANKYLAPVENSSDVLIMNKYDFSDKKTWVLKTIVNSQLVQCCKEVCIEKKEQEANDIAIKELISLAKKTWTDKNIIVYDIVRDTKYNENSQSKPNFNVLSWISE